MMIMKNKQVMFLETSIHIKRLFGYELLKREIKNNIRALTCYTSFFVFYEFKRRVIKTLIDFYYVLQEEDTLADALKYYNQTSYKPRGTKIIVDALAVLLSDDDLRNSKSKALANIEMLIVFSLQNFRDSIKGFVQNKVQSQCPLSKASITNGRDDFEEFQRQIKCEAKCHIAQFWKKHRGTLEIFTKEELIESHKSNKGFAKMLLSLRMVLEDHEKGQTITNCLELADAIIAIEMPKDYTMLTFDRSFESLCPLMGKAVEKLPSLSDLKKRQSLDQNCQISQTKS
jgi:hypothetical protein